ncbi:MAG: ABC transporter permease [Capsulimonadales bacterium]|nr:ABC transporter permease [Capsulimonadales bacterium]
MNQTVTLADRKPVVLRPATRWSAFNLEEVLHYSDLLTMFALRDVKLRYRQTALGVIWVVFQPLLAAAIFLIIFNKVAQTPTDDISPFVFYYAGLMAYKSFENTVNKASMCMIGNAQLVAKVFFPRIILPVSTVLGSLLDFAVSAVVLAVLMLVFRVPPSPFLLLLPVWLLFLQLTALGLGFYFAALTVRYRDIQYALPVLVQFGLYATPVGFSVAFLLGKLPKALHFLVFLNPLTGLLDAFRWSVLGTPIYSWPIVIYGILASVALFVLGAMAFTQMEQSFADVI